MARKTFDVEQFKAEINDRLRLSHDDQAPARLMACAILENVLMATGNYRGYAYNVTEWDRGELRPDMDDTRRHYF